MLPQLGFFFNNGSMFSLLRLVFRLFRALFVFRFAFFLFFLFLRFITRFSFIFTFFLFFLVFHFISRFSFIFNFLSAVTAHFCARIFGALSTEIVNFSLAYATFMNKLHVGKLAVRSTAAWSKRFIIRRMIIYLPNYHFTHS